MFSHIDIANFGSYSGLVWKNCVKDASNTVQKFKRLNILYGRNYSGKTTLSRIFRSLETGRIPLNFDDTSFTLHGDKGEVTQADIASHGYEVRVYNRDFVNENLSLLVNQTNGEIKTFAIVGEKNKDIESQIAEIEHALGSAESKSGLKFEMEAKKKERDQIQSDYKDASESLDAKLRSHANDKIKQNRIYGLAVYNIDGIKKDINTIAKMDFKLLNFEEQAAKVNVLKQDALPAILNNVTISLEIEPIRQAVEELLSRPILPIKAIQDLLNETTLQAWVKQGIPLHKDKRSTCAFCRQDLPHDIWQDLAAHFSRESTELESSIDSCIATISRELRAIPSFLTVTGGQFYAEEKILFETLAKASSELLSVYEQDLLALRSALEKRKSSLFQIGAMPVLKHDYASLQNCVSEINALITKSNGRTGSLEQDKYDARESLRLNDVATFIGDITYESEKAQIARLKEAKDTANKDVIDFETQIAKHESDVTNLQSQQKDERKGADRVNVLLNHFFGHQGLKLEAKDIAGKTAVKFEVTRAGRSAYNLSEGESSLIAFCYFLAKLEEPDSKGKELIIYIDDPISSLDGNHIFLMFSLIESLIAKPIKKSDGSNRYRYKQLFISTHNLDFLKYLKKISLPNEKNHGGNQQFIIERNGGASKISLMPSYLREYITEFNYLFHQIYKCRIETGQSDTHEPYYGFGNNLRKFLEVFLFFKFPHHEDKGDPFERIKKFFGEEDATAIALVNRLNNELSHLEAIPDRAFKPMEIPEISKVANFVLDKIYATDPVQYNSLLKSIGEPERVG